MGHGILRSVKLGVNLDSPSTEPILKGVEVLLELEGCYGGVYVGRQQSSAISECKRDGGMLRRDRGVYYVEHRRKDTSLGHSGVCREIRRER